MKLQKYYKNIYKKYKIICNNSVNGGDCLGETYCNNGPQLNTSENRIVSYLQCAHTNFYCRKCTIMICQCCYKKCPCCNQK